MEFSYNVNAMLDTVTNPDGSTVNYDYDVLDELIGKSYDNEEDPQALYGYDLDGNRISMDDVAGTTGYEYDEVGRITAVNLSNGKKIKYSYDEYGNISKLTYPDNTTVQYTYNELDQLTQIKDRQGKITKYDRDANGNITKVTRPNNTYSTIEYDDMGNVIKVVNMGKNPYYNISEELSTFAYTYDASGFITGEVAKNGRRIETSQYEYDERGQLVKVSQTVTENNKFVEETEMVYTYDGAGNRLSAVKTSSDKTLCNIQYTYNDNSQITDIESNCDDDKQTHIVLTYDENGNLKNSTCNDTEKVRDYTYDNENRLKAVKENGSLLMAALYDGNGDRIFRLDYRKNSDYVSNKAGTAENVYYPSGSVNSSYDTDVILNEMLIPNGVTNNTAINYELTGYINDINTEYTQTLMEFGANGNTANVYEYGDGRNSATINGTKGYYLYDGRGSVAGLTGNSGGSMITYRYDAYGNTTKSNNTLNNPYQYNAEYTDSSTGLQYLRARYYDSSQGRFTAKDTYLGEIEYPLSRNLYTYCYNNPLNYTDPSGHFGILAAMGIGAAIGAVVSGGINIYTQHKNGTLNKKDFQWGSFWTSVGIGAAAGAVGGLVGGVAGLATSAAIGALGGSTTSIAAGISIGVAGSISGGMAYRYTDTKLGNAINGTNNNALKAAYNPIGIMVDGILGGLGGAISAAFASGKIKNPFKHTSGTKGEQSAAKAFIEKIKKFCGLGAEHIDDQKVKPPVDLPESSANSSILTGEQYSKYLKTSQHNVNSNDVMLGKYDNNSPSNYINQAKNNGYSYFDMGDDFTAIEKQYGYTDNDMFDLFNKPFLDDAIAQGKTFHFSHNPVNDKGALGKEFEYLIEHGYSWDESSMTMTR